MNMTGIIIAAAVVGIVGIVIGVLLGIASEKFKVEVDEKEILVRAELPGNNCGGCGYAGCDALAKAIAEGKAKVDQCPVGGAPVGEKIAAIMGVEAGSAEKKVAFVKCKGTCDKATVKYNYYGIDDCHKIADAVPGGGSKGCNYGCLGSGSCEQDLDKCRSCVKCGVIERCPVHCVSRGPAGKIVVDKEKCVACGKCAEACPRHLIELVPYKANHLVQCSSHDKGPAVKKVCEAGCIGCTLCTKQCEFDAIHMDNNVAVIDYTKCTGCGKCAAKCPAHVII